MSERAGMPASYDEDLAREPEDVLSDAERFQVREARDSLTRWNAGRTDGYGYDRERVLADHVKALLAIVDELAPAGESGA